MKNSSVGRHLRLVTNLTQTALNDTQAVGDFVVTGESSSSDGGDFLLYFASENNVLKNQEYEGFLKSCRPSYLFDVREAPRLDFLASSRALAFRKFADWGINYVDILGLASDAEGNECSMPEFWVDLIREKVNCVDLPNILLAFIFDDDDVLRRSCHVLPAALKKFSNRASVRVDIFDGKSVELMAM